MEEGNLDSTEMFQVQIDTPSASEEETNNLPRKTKSSCSTICPFSKKDYSESDAAERSQTSVKLCRIIIFYSIVMVIEILGGLKANSLAILTDAIHLLSDIAGFSISLFTVWVSGWEATPHHSFGFNRLEVIGALLSVQLIWLISGNLIYEAVVRLITKQMEVNGGLMFATAAFGFLVNLVLVLWLGHDHAHHHGHAHHHEHEMEESRREDQENTNLVSTPHGKTDHGHSHYLGLAHHDHPRHEHEMEESWREDQERTNLVSIPHGKTDLDHSHYHSHPHHEHGMAQSRRGDQESTNLLSTPHGKTEMLNINIQGAYLHLVTDLIQSAGVVIAGSIIWAKPHWLFVDLVCTLIFSVVALGTTLPMLKNIFYVLMEKAPSGIDTARLENGLKTIRGVRDVHDLHVWAISVGKHVLSCHVVVGPEVGCDEIIHGVREYCEKAHGIHHVTVQIEQEM